ncbi:MAG: APC family permease [Bdellovibrionota bacterium]
MGLLIAGLLRPATLSSAELASAHPVSGGTYEYGYRYLSPAFGFAAGALFLVAKSASAATAALGLGAYLVRLTGWNLPFHWLGLGLATSIAFAGIRRSTQVNGILVGLTLVSLFAFVYLGFARSPVSLSTPPTSFWESVALLFVAFTGYGRIATLGEEVRAPRKTLPAAIVICLLICGGVYAAVGFSAMRLVGASEFYALALAGSPLEQIAWQKNSTVVAWVLGLGASFALCGVMLNLILGLSRIVLAMGRRGDLPESVAQLDAKQNPTVAVLIAAGLIAVWVGLGSIKGNWELSAFTVLIYYGVTNLAALRLRGTDLLYPKAISAMGLLVCFGLLYFLSLNTALLGGTALLAAFATRALFKRRSF